MYCLNTALKLYTSVVVVPVFYGTYTALGLVNTIIYLDELSNYPPWAIFLVFVGIGVLIYGVTLLSSKPDTALESDEEGQELDESTWSSEKPLSDGDGSTKEEERLSDQLEQSPISSLLRRLTSPLQRREMDTFISLHSVASDASINDKPTIPLERTNST